MLGLPALTFTSLLLRLSVSSRWALLSFSFTLLLLLSLHRSRSLLNYSRRRLLTHLLWSLNSLLLLNRPWPLSCSRCRLLTHYLRTFNALLGLHRPRPFHSSRLRLWLDSAHRLRTFRSLRLWSYLPIGSRTLDANARLRSFLRPRCSWRFPRRVSYSLALRLPRSRPLKPPQFALLLAFNLLPPPTQFSLLSCAALRYLCLLSARDFRRLITTTALVPHI